MRSKKPTASQSRPNTDLKSMYRAIGISAVAAALHYKGETRNPAYAPAPSSPEEQERFHEAA